MRRLLIMRVSIMNVIGIPDFKLPIWVDNSSHYIKGLTSSDYDRNQRLPANFFDTRPKLRIKDVLFGTSCGITVKEFPQFKRQIEDIILYNYGYAVSLSSDFIRPKPPIVL